MALEDNLGQIMATRDPDKSYIDKILARKEIEQIRVIMKKEELSRADLLDLMYLCSSAETKLANLDEYSRYVILKFFVWIRELIKVAELMYDNEDHLSKSGVKLKDRTITILKRNKQLIQHDIKFLIDLYMNIQRTTLSLNAMALNELMRNKFEVSYPQMGIQNNAQKPSVISGEHK